MLRVQGVGPKKAALMHKELGIDGVNALEKAAREHRIRDLPGMGAKSEENILRGIRLRQAGAERMLLDVAGRMARPEPLPLVGPGEVGAAPMPGEAEHAAPSVFAAAPTQAEASGWLTTTSP